MLDKYADLYSRLATLADSGMTLTDAFSMLAESDYSAIRRGLGRAVRVIDEGGNLKESLEAAQIFEPYEIKMLVAGDRAGHLPAICARLSEQREMKAKRIQQIIMQSAYPILLIHLAVLGPSLFILVQSGANEYAKTVLPILGAFYFFALLPFAIFRIAKEFPPLRYALDYFLLQIPFVGKCILKHHLAQMITIFQGLYSSGIGVVEALEDMIDVCKHSVLRSCFYRIHKRVLRHATLAQAVQGESILPNYVRNMIATGETSGKLDETLVKARDLLDHEAATSAKMLLSVLSTLLFLLAALFVAYKVVSFYSGYFNQIRSILGTK